MLCSNVSHLVCTSDPHGIKSAAALPAVQTCPVSEAPGTQLKLKRGTSFARGRGCEHYQRPRQLESNSWAGFDSVGCTRRMARDTADTQWNTRQLHIYTLCTRTHVSGCDPALSPISVVCFRVRRLLLPPSCRSEQGGGRVRGPPPPPPTPHPFKTTSCQPHELLTRR